MTVTPGLLGSVSAVSGRAHQNPPLSFFPAPSGTRTSFRSDDSNGGPPRPLLSPGAPAAPRPSRAALALLPGTPGGGRVTRGHSPAPVQLAAADDQTLVPHTPPGVPRFVCLANPSVNVPVFLPTSCSFSAFFLSQQTPRPGGLIPTQNLDHTIPGTPKSLPPTQTSLSPHLPARLPTGTSALSPVHASAQTSFSSHQSSF